MIHLTINLEQENPALLNKKEEERGTLFSIKGTEILLDLFKKHNIKTTIFVSGFFAENFSDIVKRIVREGHEVGCHGYRHFYEEMDKRTLQEDIMKAREILERIFDLKILGFRAPQMMYVPDVVEAVHQLGFSYDSSLYSAWMPFKFNHKLSPLKPFHPLRSGPFMEIPISGSPRMRLPLNSHMIRKYGSWWAICSCKKLKKNNINPVLSIHSWDLFPTNGEGLPSRYLRNTGMKFFLVLEKIIRAFPAQEFTPLKTELRDQPNELLKIITKKFI